MIIIPGWLISLLTFPGVIVHEAAHLLFCRLRRIPVLEVCFFRVGNPVGYVIHTQTDDFTSLFLVAVGPFIVNTLACFLICFPAFLRVRIFELGDALSFLLLWLGVSIGMHAFPSMGDGKALWAAARKEAGHFALLALVSFPLVMLIYAANVLSILWLDYVYGLLIGLVLPELVLRVFA